MASPDMSRVLEELADVLCVDLEYAPGVRPPFKGYAERKVAGVFEALGVDVLVGVDVQDALVDPSGQTAAALVRITNTLWLACSVDMRDGVATVLVLDGKLLHFPERLKKAHSVRIYVSTSATFSRRKFCETVLPGVVAVFERHVHSTQWHQWTEPKKGLEEYLNSKASMGGFSDFRQKHCGLVGSVASATA